MVDKDEFKDLSKIMTSNEINDFVNTLNKIVMDGAELCVLTNKMASKYNDIRCPFDSNMECPCEDPTDRSLQRHSKKYFDRIVLGDENISESPLPATGDR